MTMSKRVKSFIATNSIAVWIAAILVTMICVCEDNMTRDELYMKKRWSLRKLPQSRGKYLWVR